MAAASVIARRLEGKVAIITGGASGIGEATVRLFHQHGAKVVIADIQDDLADKICKDLDPTSVVFVHCDVSNENDIENTVKVCLENFGKLDIMFNNAGIIGAWQPCITNDEKPDFDRVIPVNLVGAFLGTKHAATAMVSHRRGSIINTTSVAATVGGAASHAYTCSKHALLGLTRSTAADLGRFGIRVNCVSPYAVLTGITRSGIQPDKVYRYLDGAILKAEDISEAVVYLASDESKYVNGHNLTVDGGFSTTAHLAFYKA